MDGFPLFCVYKSCQAPVRVIKKVGEISNHSDHIDDKNQLNMTRLDNYVKGKTNEIKRLVQSQQRITHSIELESKKIKTLVDKYLQDLGEQLKKMVTEKLGYLDTLMDLNKIAKDNPQNKIKLDALSDIEQNDKNIKEVEKIINDKLQAISSVFQQSTQKEKPEDKDKETQSDQPKEQQIKVQVLPTPKSSNPSSKQVSEKIVQLLQTCWSDTLKHPNIVIQKEQAFIGKKDGMFHSVFLDRTFEINDTKIVKFKITWDEKLGLAQKLIKDPCYWQYSIGFQLMDRRWDRKISYSFQELEYQQPHQPGSGVIAFYMDQYFSPFIETELNKYQRGFFSPEDIVVLTYDGQNKLIKLFNQTNQKIFQAKVKFEQSALLTFGVFIFGAWKAVIIN